MTRILVPTAGTTEASQTAEYVVNVAKAIDADVTVLQVIRRGHSSEAAELALEFFTNAGNANGVNVECVIVEGPVIETIVDYAEEHDIDLIVMGVSQGRVIEQWLSSDIRSNTAVPVLLIPFQIFE